MSSFYKKKGIVLDKKWVVITPNKKKTLLCRLIDGFKRFYFCFCEGFYREFEIDGNQSFDIRVEALNIPINFFFIFKGT